MDHWPDPTVTVVQQLELRPVVRNRIRVGALTPAAPKSTTPWSRPATFPLGQSTVERCEACLRAMRVVVFSGKGSVMFSREELAMGIGGAEQCWECGRLYCDRCYPARERNTCVCGRGRDTIRDIGGTVYRGSLRLVKVEYMECHWS